MISAAIMVRAQAQAGVSGLCMSEETARRLNTLVGEERFFNFAPPAMQPAERKRLAVMVSGRLYDDGRKNESWVIDFFRAFRPGDVLVQVMGAGWAPRLEALRSDYYGEVRRAAVEALARLPSGPAGRR